MDKKILLTSLAILLIISFGVVIILFNDEAAINITGNSIKSTTNEGMNKESIIETSQDIEPKRIRAVKINDSLDENPKEVVNPYKRDYETFEIVQTGPQTEVAILLYNLSLKNLNFEEEGLIIKFFPEKEYLGFGELESFFKETGINVVVGYEPDIDGLTKIRRSTGISVMIHFASGVRERVEGISETGELRFNFDN